MSPLPPPAAPADGLIKPLGAPHHGALVLLSTLQGPALPPRQHPHGQGRINPSAPFSLSPISTHLAASEGDGYREGPAGFGRSTESDPSQSHNVKVGTPSTHHPNPYGCCAPMGDSAPTSFPAPRGCYGRGFGTAKVVVAAPAPTGTAPKRWVPGVGHGCCWGCPGDGVCAPHRVPSRCGSRESLLPAPSVAELDLNGDNVLVRPLHGSIVGERFCFQVITGEGSRSFGCTSLAERDRWIEELRRTAQPNKDNRERLELSLSLWVYEGRDLPPRRRLRCHLHLDGALFARTTAKVAGPDGDLFWGELFQLGALPPTRALTLALCHEEDPTQPVASITIPLTELLGARQPLERWYPLGGPGERVPALRVRGRYREVRVLPIVRYKELAEFITFHYRELCAHLEPIIAARHKEELAGALVRVLHSTGKAKSFLIDLGVAELERFDDHEALIFRENTLATKAIDEYMKLVGGKYLQDTLGMAEQVFVGHYEVFGVQDNLGMMLQSAPESYGLG
uniref:Uncharacterized protein n=1 Tax=Amazona collaria TaxID=241587 RepID=A0A8B9IWR6_9PSIT